MERCDVVIVGGGPAGSSCARDLVRAGLDVVVIERARFPRHKPCAGWITPPVLGMLGVDPEAYAAGRTLQAITGFRVGVGRQAPRDVDFDRTVSYGILRSEFDQFLLERCGARAATGAGVTRIERMRDSWIVNGTFEASMLVGAGGHFCPVAARVQSGRQTGPLVLAQEIEVLLTGEQAARCRTRPTLPSLFFCQDLQGYGWVFRKGGVLNVGFGRQDPSGFATRAREFIAWLVETGEIPADVPAAWHGHAYLLWGRPHRAVVTDGALLVGDAAGLAAPASGEGIRPAVESGQLAARTIIEAEGDYARDRLEAYRTRLDEHFGPPLAPPERVSRAADRLQRALGAHLMRWPWFAGRLLAGRFLGIRVGGRRPRAASREARAEAPAASQGR